MHELSIAQSIVAIAEEEVSKAQAHVVDQIVLDIGKLSGVEIDALNFVWDIAVKDSVLSQAEKIINHLPGKARCTNCNTSFEMENMFDACPVCHDYFNEIIGGKELKIKSLTIT